MLRATVSLLRVQSHQKKRSQHPNAGTRFGRVYNRGFVRYGFGGFGMSTYSTKKDRTFKTLPPQSMPIGGPHAGDEGGLAPTTQTLSPNFRTFALADGGVFVTHPSHSQIMQWNGGVLQADAKAAAAGPSGGMTSMDQFVNSRIQAIIADNTIENVSLSQWRRTHMWNIIKSHGNLQRRWGTPEYVKGMRTTLYNS